MNMKIVALACLVVFVVFASIAIPRAAGSFEAERNTILVVSYGFVATHNGTGTNPLGDPIDTPGMPT